MGGTSQQPVSAGERKYCRPRGFLGSQGSGFRLVGRAAWECREKGHRCLGPLASPPPQPLPCGRAAGCPWSSWSVSSVDRALPSRRGRAGARAPFGQAGGGGSCWAPAELWFQRSRKAENGTLVPNQRNHGECGAFFQDSLFSPGLRRAPLKAQGLGRSPPASR